MEQSKKKKREKKTGFFYLWNFDFRAYHYFYEAVLGRNCPTIKVNISPGGNFAEGDAGGGDRPKAASLISFL